MTAPTPVAHIAAAAVLATVAVVGWLSFDKPGGGMLAFAESPMTAQEFGARQDAIIKEQRTAEDACKNYDSVQRRSGRNPLCIEAAINKYSAMLNDLQDERKRRNNVQRSTARTPQVPDSFYGNAPDIRPCPPNNPHAPQTFSYSGCR